MTGAAAAKRKKEVRGAIDLGSSYFRLLVVEGVFEPGAILVGSSREERVYTGWGEDLSIDGRISEVSARRAATALGALVRSAAESGCGSPEVVSTNTLRRADNGAEVSMLLERSAGLGVRILSEEEEARLGFAGACTLFPRGTPAVLADPGGTSTEIAWGRSPRVEGFLSAGIGTHVVASMMSGRGGGGISARTAASRVEEAILREAGGGVPGPVSRLPASVEGHNIILTGGTAVSLAVISNLLERAATPPGERTGMTAGRARLLMRRIRKLLRRGRGRSVPLDPHRVSLLPAGTALLEGILRVLEPGRFDIVTRDLRWGVLLERG